MWGKALKSLARCLFGVLCAGLGQPAWAACSVGGMATLSFGPVIALASTANADSNTGVTFWLACDEGALPALYSGTTRTLQSGANQLPVLLSLSAPGGAELPSTFPGTALTLVGQGEHQVIPLYGRLRTADFRLLPAGVYGGSLVLTVVW